MAATLCSLCHRPIGYGVRFYREPDETLIHALCLEEKIEQEMMLT